LTKTKKLPLSSSNGLMLTLSLSTVQRTSLASQRSGCKAIPQISLRHAACLATHSSNDVVSCR
jgi:hypothetical protein